ncbi:MAG: hypothetical protein ACK56F_17545, partial [bacterium]
RSKWYPVREEGLKCIRRLKIYPVSETIPVPERNQFEKQSKEGLKCSKFYPLNKPGLHFCAIATLNSLD